MDARETLTYFERRLDAIMSLIASLVDIESPSHNVRQSKIVVDRVAEIFRELPLDLNIEREAVEGYGEHLIVRAFESEEKPLLLLGHTDTVHPIGTNEKNPTRVVDDQFFGCGIFDMKANIVLMAEALRVLATNGSRPKRPVTILLSCDEEVGSKTGKALVLREATKAAACLVFEPSLDGKAKTGRKGTGMFTLHAHGVPAHAGLEPEKGASAILELSHQIKRLHDLNDLEAGTTVSVCTIKGGTTSNVIPEYAECEIDVRFASMAEASRVEKAIRSLSPVDSRVTLELSGEINRPPMERTPAVAVLFEKAREIASSFGYGLGEAQVGGGSDGNFVGMLGVPVLDGLGIAGAGAHTLSEHILVGDIAKRATLVTHLLLNA
jgi:glutamate carboxypeptidase